MLLQQLISKLETIAPEENGFPNDVYGLQFGLKLTMDRFNVTKTIIALDPTEFAIAKAIKEKANLLITHHGLTHVPIMNFNDDILTKFSLLAQHRIQVYTIHTAWDAAPSGVTESLAKRVGLEIERPFLMYHRHNSSHGKPLGRICKPYNSTITVEKLASEVKRKLGVPYCQVFGKLDKYVTQVAVSGGKGFTTRGIWTAVEDGCDCLLTGEITYKEENLAETFDIPIITAGHYATEFPGMESLQKILTLECPRDEFILFEEKKNNHFI